MTATQVNLTERGETVVSSKKRKKKKKRFSPRIRLRFLNYYQHNLVLSLHLESDSDLLHFFLKFVTTTQEGSSLLKSTAHRSFLFTRDNLQAFATHFWVAIHGLRNTAIVR